ncbi:MAG: hypothetical protein ACREBE_17735, partial [bacterium]
QEPHAVRAREAAARARRVQGRGEGGAVKHGGEQPGTEDRGSRAVTEDDADADTTAQLRAMRSVWLSMRDEAPPDGGLVDLLSAARAKAETLRARPTLRQRLAAWVRRPPALAFATVVVLVGGAVLVLGRSSGHRGSDLAAGSSGAITERAAPPAPSVSAAPVPVSGVPAERSTGVVDEPSPVEERDHVSMELPAARRLRHSVMFDEAEGLAQLEQLLDQLSAQCVAEAKRGDCASVRKILGKIAEVDPDVRARVAKDAAVARCRPRAVDAAAASAE